MKKVALETIIQVARPLETQFLVEWIKISFFYSLRGCQLHSPTLT